MNLAAATQAPIPATVMRMLQKIRKLVIGLRTLSSNPLLINAYVTVNNGDVAQANWGDDINYYLIRHLTKRNVSVYFDNPLAVSLKSTNYLCIGSTLNYLTTNTSVVWGAGVIDENLRLRAKPRRVCAVRGPLTRNYLLAQGVECPEIYGDPALLIPFFYRPACKERRGGRRICIIPHYADADSSALAPIKTQHPDVSIIDVAHYGKWTDFIDRICEHDVVFSSSLHGLMVAESYGIPNHWIRLSDKVIGNGFKFRDFYRSIGKKIEAPVIVESTFDPVELASRPWTQGTLNLSKLLNACPFRINEPISYEHPMGR
jgi:pyruvyltransferase